MPEGPLGFPRLYGLGPFSVDDCELNRIKRRTVRHLSESIYKVVDDPTDLPQDEIESLKDSLGYDLVGEGGRRIVFRMSDECVLKVTKEMRPFQNKAEVSIWNDKLAEHERKYFAPVIDYDNEEYRFVTSLYAEQPVSDDDFIELAEKVFLDFGMDFVDFRKENVGYIDGRAVIVDYGTGFNRIDDVNEWSSREEAWEFFKSHAEVDV